MIMYLVLMLSRSRKKKIGIFNKILFATVDESDFQENVVSQIRIQPEEWSKLAMFIYRFGRFIHYHSRKSLRKKFWVRVYRYYFIKYMLGRLGLNIYYTVPIGFGTKIYHPFGIVINAKAKIGKNTKIRQGTTIGNRGNNKGGSPVIGDNVDIGSNSVIIGEIKIGNNSKIGAGSVVVKSFPEKSVIVGNPGKNVNIV